ncbi:MAG: PEP-CTERM sorting domain-containing protein [Gemmatimonadetes bacterium]|nr:PEP-CTERM sorting domain-containing protein [Gemmatimonadota bacterium]
MDNLGLDQPGGPQDVVPEPATMTLLATGLIGMAAARRRKQAAK